jgi:hypothetical protein
MRHPFIAALFITVLLASGYFALRGRNMSPPAATAPPSAPPAVVPRTTPASPLPALADMSVDQLLVRAQQETDRGDYDEALRTLRVAHQKDPQNQQIADLTEKALEAKHASAIKRHE